MNLRLQKAVLFFGLFGGAADDRVEPRHDFERLRRAPVFGHAFLEVAVEILRAGEAVLPTVAWGLKKDALPFPTEADAARTIARLRPSGPHFRRSGADRITPEAGPEVRRLSAGG